MSSIGVTENEEMGSSDEALLEMLGLTSLDTGADEEEVSLIEDGQKLNLSIHAIAESQNLAKIYNDESMCILPKELSIPSAQMRRLTDELVWGGSKYQADRTYETIQVLKKKSGEIENRRTLTRLENFVNDHDEWKTLCHGHLAHCISALFGEPMVLYKEKLNLKPPGGSGFAPHLDTPSLRVALGGEGPQTFVTVMVAIDNMTTANGCLRICKGEWSEQEHCTVIQPEEDGNPDAGGRAGAIPAETAHDLEFHDVECQGGDIVAFNGWAPHRSSANASPFPRRAVFLTYNPKSEGDFHDRYYERMEEIRNAWRSTVGLSGGGVTPDEKLEIDALATIPHI
jgi:hypothetical protein